MNKILQIGFLAFSFLLSQQAMASVDEKCADLPKPDDYDEQVQQDFLANFFALSTTFSPIHGPIPHEAGHGAISFDFLVIPPLGCAKRYVLDWTKTEETNKAPVVPRPRITFAFPLHKRVIPYGGLAYLPPITLMGTRNVILSGELGVGFKVTDDFHLGTRGHATVHKTVADVASAFNDEDPVVLDLFVASTFGVDAMIGYQIGPVTPYAAVGFTDASTFFLVGDNNHISDNLHPYFGPTFSVGADALFIKRLRVSAEFYGAPGGFSKPDPDVASVKPASRYGHLYTGRIRVGVEL